MKIIRSEVPQTLYNKINISTRNNGNLVLLPQYKSDHFLYNMSIIWNKLLQPLKVPNPKIISINIFKAKLKKHLLAKQVKGNKAEWLTENLSL